MDGRPVEDNGAGGRGCSVGSSGGGWAKEGEWTSFWKIGALLGAEVRLELRGHQRGRGDKLDVDAEGRGEAGDRGSGSAAEAEEARERERMWARKRAAGVGGTGWEGAASAGADAGGAEGDGVRRGCGAIEGGLGCGGQAGRWGR